MAGGGTEGDGWDHPQHCPGHQGWLGRAIAHCSCFSSRTGNNSWLRASPGHAAGGGGVSPWDTLQRRVLVVLHRGRVPFPWSSLCRSSWALLCSSRIKLPKEFLFNLLLSLSPSAPPAPVSSPMHAAAAQHRVCRSTPGSSSGRLPPTPGSAAPLAALGWGQRRLLLCWPPLPPARGHFPRDIKHCFQAWFCHCFGA